MKVFISWSGELSQKLAEAIRVWLPTTIQAVKPYFTPNDIEKGARWHSEIAIKLEDCQVGILCLTKSNLDSPWMLFEAGALSKSLGESSVCPILFGLEPTDIKGPLEQFQLTRFNEKDFKKLLSTINKKCGEGKLEDSTLDAVFNMWWPRLKEELTKIIKNNHSEADHPERTDRDLLEEILSTVRLLSKNDAYSQQTTFKDDFPGIMAQYLASKENKSFDRKSMQHFINLLQEEGRLKRIEKLLDSKNTFFTAPPESDGN